jgi:hypothetical protein
MAKAGKRSANKSAGKRTSVEENRVTAPDFTAALPAQCSPAATPAFLAKPWHSWALLTILVLAALLPFSNRAFHIDDTLFVFAGKNIVKQPLNPYGFPVNWDDVELPMSQVTKNPPLACYYVAAVGALAGWSERALHLAFLIPALAVPLATYRLAHRFTQAPLLAAFLTIASPGYLVSAASVMCDTMMLAIWLGGIVLWVEGLETKKPFFLTSSALLMGAAGLTKYYGAALIPLLFAYTIYRERRLGRWVLYFLIPIAAIAAYQLWTASLYTEGLISDAAGFASSQKERAGFLAETIEGLSFVGGCMLPAVLLAPWLWSRRQILFGLLAAGAGAFLITSGMIVAGNPAVGSAIVAHAFQEHRALFPLELTLFIAGGISTVALAVSDFRLSKSANSLLLLLWVVGTLAFTCYFNWTVNGRSVLPLLSAVGILMGRRLVRRRPQPMHWWRFPLAVPLLVSAGVALWVLIGDSQLANTSRAAALRAKELTRAEQNTLWFTGHWGLQYYMEEMGARPVDKQRSRMAIGDFLLIPENRSSAKVTVSPYTSCQILEFPGPSGAITINDSVAAGFYSSFWGPLPFFLGQTPPERYTLVHLVSSGVSSPANSF